MLAHVNSFVYLAVDFQTDQVIPTSELRYLWVYTQTQHAWVVGTQAQGAFRSKSPSVWLPSHVQTYTQAHVPNVPFARRHSLINVAFPILCHSTPVREARIDRQSSLAWSIASFYVPLFLAVSHSAATLTAPQIFLSLLAENAVATSILHFNQSPHLIIFSHQLFPLSAVQSHRVEAGSQWTCALYITEVMSTWGSPCSLPPICTASCSQQRAAGERLEGHMKPFMSHWIEYRCCTTSLALSGTVHETWSLLLGWNESCFFILFCYIQKQRLVSCTMIFSATWIRIYWFSRIKKMAAELSQFYSQLNLIVSFSAGHQNISH